jgi:hypothetical protein
VGALGVPSYGLQRESDVSGQHVVSQSGCPLLLLVSYSTSLWSHIIRGHAPPKDRAFSEPQCVNDPGDHTPQTNKLRGLSLRANYTERPQIVGEVSANLLQLTPHV